MSLDELMHLAIVKFPDLTEPELHLLDCIAAEDVWNRQVNVKDKNDPIHAADWGPERVLRANLISWLCTDIGARRCVSEEGIMIFGARIEGDLNLSSAEFGKTILLAFCAITGKLESRDALFSSLNLSGSYVENISAERVIVKGKLILGLGFTAIGSVLLQDAEIGGSLSCVGGSFLNENGLSLSLDRIKVKGSVYMRGRFVAKGEVRLSGAEIGENLECEARHFGKGGGELFHIDGLKVNGRCIFG